MPESSNFRFKLWHLLPQRLLPGKQLAIAEACLIGLVSALAAVLFKQSIGWLGAWRVHTATILPPGIILPMIGLSLGLLSGLIVERFAPEAAGSGIPHVKASLAQYPMRLDLKVAVVKLVSGILAISSGMTLGRQGPTVHIGAAVAAQLSHWLPTSPDHRRQMIAAGAGAGLAAGFNAPIAGVLFVVEELLHDVSNLTLGTAILASFIGAVVSRLLGGGSLNLNLELIGYRTSFFAQEIPFYLLLGLLAGGFGALFCEGVFTSLNFYSKVLKLNLPGRMALAGLISGIAIAILPTSFRDNTGLREFLIAGDGGWQSGAIAFIAHFILTLVACGSGAPGGLFAPSLVLGSALGYLVGLGEAEILSIGLPTTYALAGMGAFFSAVGKVPITAIVIVFEMTMDFNLVLPLMIACVTAYLVSEKLSSGSLYDRLLAYKGIHLSPETAQDGLLTELTAADVMQRKVETLSCQMPIQEVVQAFSRSHHRGFPVVENDQLIGIVTQTDLAKWQQRASKESALGNLPVLRDIMTPQPITVIPKASLSHVLYLLNRFQLSRLPVTEGRKLVGIITRADIIRAEADCLEEGTGSIGPQPQASYVLYQTRAPEVGTGRLLVPLSNPETAKSILQLAAAIARDRHYELECLCCHLVPRNLSPAEAEVRTTRSRRLLRQAESLGREWKIPVHTQIRATHDISQAILEAIAERHIDLLVMGWKGNTLTPGRIFGSAVDAVIRQAPCHLVLVKLGAESSVKWSFNRWLLPMAGGPNAEQAVTLLPALISVADAPQIRLCQVFPPTCQIDSTPVLDRAVDCLRQKLGNYKKNGQGQKDCRYVPISGIHLRSSSVSDAVITLAQADGCDVVVLGASREGLLQHVVKGNIPEAIARGVSSTVILVRNAI